MGWEFAAPIWLVYSLSVDSNFIDDVVVSPVVEATTPSFMFMPFALAIGAGPAFRLTGGGEVGIRAQATASFLPLGFAATVDIYPGRDRDHADLTFYGQFTF